MHKRQAMAYVMIVELMREMQEFSRTASENLPQGRDTQSRRATKDQQQNMASGDNRSDPQTCTQIFYR